MDKRPVNLNLLTIRFPITAWVSILHRVSGFFVFLLIPYLLWILQQSLSSEENFQALQQQFTHPIFTFAVWIGFSALMFHFVAGIRHLLMDKHIGESKRGGKIGAMLVFIVSVLFIVICAQYV